MRERAVAGGAISVEISARFDGAVVSVHHLVVGPRGPTWPTRLLFAAGALGLLGSIGLLAAAARGASGPACTVAFGVAVLLAAGCLPLAWLRRSDEGQPRDFTVGPGRGADLPLPEHLASEPLFALVRLTDRGFELRGPQGASRLIEIDDRAHVILGGIVLQIAAGLPPRRYRLAPPTRWLARLMEGATGVWIATCLCILLPIAAALLGALYQHRGHSLRLEPADARHARIAFGPEDAPRAPAPQPPAQDRSVPATPHLRTAQSASVAPASRASTAPAALALATIPQDAIAAAQAPTASDAASASAAPAQASLAAQAEAGAAPAPTEVTSDAPANASATAHEPPAAVASAGSGATAPARDEVRRLAQEQAVRSSLLGMFRGTMAGARDALAGGGARGGAGGATPQGGPSGASASGPSTASESGAEADPMGQLVGEEIGEADGVGGLGLVGTGAGGGGSGDGTIGLGDLGTIGHGGGSGTGYGYGIGCGGLGGRSAQAPAVSMRAAEVRGALDKEIIRRVVRAHVNEVRFCYEQELQDHPTLEGRVLVEFRIAESGAVLIATAEASSLSRREAGDCIAAAVRRWTFPSAKKFGVTEVHYPFVLHTGERED